MKEAHARIKINKLLENAGWRFLDTVNERANIVLESNVKITTVQLNEQGDDFENVTNGYIDYLLLDDNEKPVAVLEAKKETIPALTGKEQARAYANSRNVNLVILSNGNTHYLWNIDKGNPEPIFSFPTPQSLTGYKTFKPDAENLVAEKVGNDYIALTQLPTYATHPDWLSETKKKEFVDNNKLRFLRYYQLDAIVKLQQKALEGGTRFLFEMATGTGKTLTAAAVIKLFLKTGNARRVLFLVDRLELEDQANRAFKEYLKNDYQCVIYKENKEDWRFAEIVVTTVQSLLVNNKYRNKFSPTDFDLVISDEAHRSIGGNSRAVFEYFLGYKLGLTATPKDYLKRFDNDPNKDPREAERRLLLDTYKTFGCESGEPTYRYTLNNGSKDGFLLQPLVLDARTDVTTKLLSEQGYAAMVTTSTSESEDVLEEILYKERHFERKFFSEETNRVFCETFLNKAARDPISNEVGKSIVFCVSQNHATKITQMLNMLADKMFPGKYQSDFAVQVTSRIADAQQMTINFTNNNLNGSSKWVEGYKSSKTRVCVTVGMMTTGYDCPDILNLAMMRPIFSPTDFIQIKGRGTRKNVFKHVVKNELGEKESEEKDKELFKLFDFFAVCEYFEEKFDYDEIIKLPKPRGENERPEEGDVPRAKEYENLDADKLARVREEQVGNEGMKIDRMFFRKFSEAVKQDAALVKYVEAGNMDGAVAYANDTFINKPEEYFTLEKLRKALLIDRKINLRELLENIFFGNQLKLKDELLDEEFDKFISVTHPENVNDIVALKYFFKAYIVDMQLRTIIDNEDYTELYHNPILTASDFAKVDEQMRKMIPEYIKTYITLNQFN